MVANGVGNNVDINGLKRKADGATAHFTWDKILDRAVKDIEYWSGITGANNIHIFGFSRGAAQSIELADRLAKDGISVDFLGLFDPVYSKGDPGVSSKLVTPTAEGSQGNFVSRELPANVEAATVIYAMNETRTWFPATKLTDASGEPSAKVVNVSAPGVHSDVGGHYGNNLLIQELALNTMITYATSKSNANFLLGQPLDAELQAAYNSTYTAFMAVRDSGKEIKPNYSNWLKAQLQWEPLSAPTYRDKASDQSISAWTPGPVGVQDGKGFWTNAKVKIVNLAKYGFLAAAEDFAGVEDGYAASELREELIFQTSEDFLVRDLDWVEKGLWDTHGRVSPDFMRKLYSYLAHPEGGWRSTLDAESKPLDTPPQA